MTHTVYVQAIRGGEGGYFASCMTCGCDPFPDRATRAEAEQDATSHGTYRDGIECGTVPIGYGAAALGHAARPHTYQRSDCPSWRS